MLHRTSWVFPLAAALTLAACEDDTTGPAPNEPGINFVAGEGLTDTIQATPLQALTVRVLDQGHRPQVGVVVRFESVEKGAGSERYSTVWVRDVAGSSFGKLALDTTDMNGQAAVRVRLGTKAGPGGVVVTVPILGLQDTARYTIQPGAAMRLSIAPKDTAVYAGRSYPLRATVMDRLGNPRTDQISYTAASGPVSVSSGGNTLSTTAVGRGLVVAQTQHLVDTSHVSIVPEGVLAAYGNPNLAVFNLDGSDYRVIVPGLSTHEEKGAPYWSPDGTQLVALFGFSSNTVFIVDLSGTVRPLVQSPNRPSSHLAAQYSRDGSWIYFGGHDCNANSRLWRVRPDGTAPELVDPIRDFTEACFTVNSHPSPSPDGQRLVYVSNRASGTLNNSGGTKIRILKVETRRVDSLDVPGYRPRWSPVADWIAYVNDGQVRIMRPDGTGQRMISVPSRRYAPGLDWSPNGEWIAVRSESAGIIDLINVQSSLTLPLAYTTGLTQPTWRQR